MMTRVVPLLLGCLLVTGMAGARLESLSQQRSVETPLLYLPNGQYLRVASLGQRAMLADLVYLWAIQYYANYEREDRYAYVEHVFGNVIAELDPHYVDPYWLGALILTLEAKDLEAGLRLLDKGYANNPDEWVLPYLAGWECRFAGQYERAAAYFAKAAETAGSPPSVRRLIAGMLGLKGDLREAYELWVAMRDDPASDSATAAIAERQARDLHVRLDLKLLSGRLRSFRTDTGGWPQRLEQLVLRGYLSTLPTDPDGNVYEYDPASGAVASRADRILGEF